MGNPRLPLGSAFTLRIMLEERLRPMSGECWLDSKKPRTVFGAEGTYILSTRL